ncbi:hypothetical protein CYY_008223 [Polysphondylium violaceum]|uniref:Uncharacterized protein n=1 Tax=Polysphondylium violaceum TaxID=133409 RepID=A0A8J4PN90_9MYCE|nr:hypothetical protein CYY_008223 [Polysphondylium violaceum]
MLDNRLAFNIKRNVILKDKNGNISEIDIVYGFIFKKYIECKCYTSQPVPLKDVAKFKEVLLMNNISPHQGLFFTTSTYVPRASTIGILTIDGEQLKSMERTSFFVGIFKSFAYVFGTALGLGLISVFIKEEYKKK